MRKKILGVLLIAFPIITWSFSRYNAPEMYIQTAVLGFYLVSILAGLSLLKAK